MVSTPTQSTAAWKTISTVLLVAFWALSLTQLLHEATHAVFGFALGAQVKIFTLWGVDMAWPAPASFWQEAMVAGSAALGNILCAGLSMWGFAHLTPYPLLRLFVFFFGAYSLFMGFGYLLIDPLLAQADSLGDWARIVMLLGGSWTVRAPLFVLGCAGTIYGYFWMGRAALYFTGGATQEPQERRRVGFLLCILPYVGLNSFFSVLAFWHPLGMAGTVIVLMQFWLGYLGFFWAFMITFVWGRDHNPTGQATALPRSVNGPLAILSLGLVLVALWLLRGITFAT